MRTKNSELTIIPQNKMKFSTYMRNNRQLYIMLILPCLYLLIFKYKPMIGVAVAFKDYNIFQGLWASEWVGLENFQEAFRAAEFWSAIKNTLVLNFGDILIGFPIPIILAVFLNELNSKFVKKSTQLILYLPYFFSWVIITGIVQQLLSGSGMVNSILQLFGLNSFDFLGNPSTWRFVYWFSGVWQGAGYGLIIYYAALTSVDASINEAAYIDGAGRFKRIWYVTLPQIRGTITMMLIMSLGNIMSISFDRPYMMGNVLVRDVSNVISTYVFSVGLQSGRFDFAAAVGLFQSLIGVTMVFFVNYLAKKLGEDGII